jgi:hypothetical protein
MPNFLMRRHGTWHFVRRVPMAHFGTQLGTPESALFMLEAATRVRSNSLGTRAAGSSVSEAPVQHEWAQSWQILQCPISVAGREQPLEQVAEPSLKPFDLDFGSPRQTKRSRVSRTSSPIHRARSKQR